MCSILSLAVLVSACSGNGSSPTAPTNPTPGAVQWSTVGSLNFDPTVVSIGRSVQIVIMMVHAQTGMNYRTEFVLVKPDGKTETKTVNATSTTVGSAGSGFGYYPEQVGTYSVRATVTQSAAGETKAPEERTGSFQATK